jgi:hypothetical protein
MDEFIQWPKPYLPLPNTCDGILSWITGIWMEFHFVSDSICNTVTHNPPRDLQGMTNNVGLTLVFMTLHSSLQLVLSKTIRIGDTKYDISCNKGEFPCRPLTNQILEVMSIQTGGIYVKWSASSLHGTHPKKQVDHKHNNSRKLYITSLLKQHSCKIHSPF